MARKRTTQQKRIRVTFDIIIEHEPGARLNDYEGVFANEIADILDTDEMQEQLDLSLQDMGDDGFPGEVTGVELRSTQIMRMR